MQALESAFKPPTYSGEGMVDAQYGGESVNVPLAPMQPPRGEMPLPQHKVLFFHILFKALALVAYLTSSIWGSSYVFTFVIVTMLMAMDFWTVKNVSGRLLVGLRWWNVIDAEGKSVWHFQSFEDQRFVHPTDSNIFWLSLFIAPVVWGVLGFAAILSFKFMWFLLVLVALGLSMINAVGYVRCKRDAGKKLTALGGSVLSRGLQAWSGMQRATGASGSQPAV